MLFGFDLRALELLGIKTPPLERNIGKLEQTGTLTFLQNMLEQVSIAFRFTVNLELRLFHIQNPVFRDAIFSVSLQFVGLVKAQRTVQDLDNRHYFLGCGQSWVGIFALDQGKVGFGLRISIQIERKLTRNRHRT